MRESKRNYYNNFEDYTPAGSLYSEEKYRRISNDSSNKGIAIIRNNVIIGAGINFAKIVGFEYSEVVGMFIMDFVAPQFRIKVNNSFKSTEELSYEIFIQKNYVEGLMLKILRICELLKLKKNKQVVEELEE